MPEATHETDAFSRSYPACPPSDSQPKPVLPGEQHFAPVFTPYVLGNISLGGAGGPKALHNLMSQAVDEAPACKGQYPMVIFAPSAGGQRQAYTQAASELASLGYVVLAVDHPSLSGVAERPSDETVQIGMFGDWINTREARSIQSNDLQFVYHRLVNEKQPLSGLPFWTNDTTVQLDACIFGHGSGGQVAQVMVETHVVKCGGPLEGILTLPAPFREKTAANSGLTANDTRHSASPSFSNGISQDSLIDLSRPGLHGLIQFLKVLRDNFLRTFGTLVCSVEGNCGPQNFSKEAPIRKRSAGDDPWWFPKNPYHKDPCYDEDYGYEDDKYEHGPGCYEDKCDNDCDDHYGDDYDDYHDPCEDPCDTFDPCNPYDGPYWPPYQPPKPCPPPGIFPPNITWPPYGGHRTPNDNHPWDDQWEDYHNDGGDYRWKYSGKYCGHYGGGYGDGYEGDYGDNYHCDQGHDHYREWDKKKHHCHGYVDDHDEDEYEDEDDDYNDGDYDGEYDDDYDYNDGDYDGEYDDDYNGEDDDDYDYDGHEDEYDSDDHDYHDHGDCHKKHHHHGHVDDHHEDKYEDDYDGDESNSGDDHGYVDDWDNEDEK